MALYNCLWFGSQAEYLASLKHVYQLPPLLASYVGNTVNTLPFPTHSAIWMPNFGDTVTEKSIEACVCNVECLGVISHCIHSGLNSQRMTAHIMWIDPLFIYQQWLTKLGVVRSLGDCSIILAGLNELPPPSTPLPSPLSQLTSIMDYNSLALLWECLAWRRQRAKKLKGERDQEKPFLLVTERACSYVVQSPHHSNGCYATIMRMQQKFETLRIELSTLATPFKLHSFLV